MTSWRTICATRYDRIDRDRRLERAWDLGGIAFQFNRALAIRLEMQIKDAKEKAA